MPFWLETKKIDLKQVEQTPEEVAKLKTELPALKKAYLASKDALTRAKEALPQEFNLSEQDEQLAEPQKTCDDARQAYRRKYAEIEDTIQLPYRSLGYPKLGSISRWMVRMRYAMFGEQSINSLSGRDVLGRDLLSRLFWGARISLVVGLVATLVSLVIGVTYGMVSGYFGGWIDNAMMRLVDIGYSIPFIFVVIFLITILAKKMSPERLAIGVSAGSRFFSSWSGPSIGSRWLGSSAGRSSR